MTDAEREVVISAGMKPWHGGDYAPDDLDDTKPLWNRAGYPADIARHPWVRWSHDGGSGDIIAYVPKPSAISSSQEQEG